MTAVTAPRPSFTVDRARWATTPPERRGIPRDQARMLVARPGGTVHARAADLAAHLAPGDLVVVNTSATRPSALDARWRDRPVVLHLSTGRDDGAWVVELRQPDQRGPVTDAGAGDELALRGGGSATLLQPVAAGPGGIGTRLWLAAVAVPADLDAHLRIHGRPIAYGPERWPLSDHQTVVARRGANLADTSAEMASAGRPLSHRVLAHLAAAGVLVAPIALHAGVSSQVGGEPPQPERVEVPATTAAVVDHVRRTGGRIVAVGTTVVRALESATDAAGAVRPLHGWTDLVITPDRGVRVVDGLLTGWHDADASHLLLLEAVAGPDLLTAAYDAALAGPHRYLWHEFGDTCLLLPRDGHDPLRRPGHRPVVDRQADQTSL